MPKNFNTLRHMALGYILIIGLAIGLITPIVQAEAPDGNLYTSSSKQTIVDGLTQSERAAKIDAFFLKRDSSPLAGYGMAMVIASDKYGIDWRLLPAIATIESNGGHMMCKSASGKNNPFGWGSCKIPFDTIEDAIDTVAKNLGGHNPRTARYYANKNLIDLLDAYNPPSIRPDYKKLVTWAMRAVDRTDAETILAMR